jgi:tetratricopeptide (TPR) repeat protein
MVAVLCSTAVLSAQGNGSEAGSTAPQKNFDAARRFQQTGKQVEAAEQYRAFIAQSLGELAIGHAQLGDYATAASYFDDALALTPNSISLRLRYAQTALELGDLSHAETLSRAFIRDSSGDSAGMAKAHQILGRALLKRYKDQDAKKEFEAAVALDPTFENGYDLAVACLDLDDDKCAGQIFNEIESSFGDTPEVHMHFGRAYGNSDFQAKAVDEFRKAIAENPRLPGAHYSLAATLIATGTDERSTLVEAEAELRKELAISPRDFLTWAALGKIAAGQQRYAEAEKSLNRAIELNPNNPDAFLYLGQMDFDLGRTAEAEKNLRQCIHLTTDLSRNRYQVQKAHFLLGRILKQQHRDDEARAEMQIARTFANKGLSEDKSKLGGLLNDSTTEAEHSGNPSADSETATGSAVHTSDPEAAGKLQNLEKRLAPAIADSYNNLGVIAATRNDYAGALTCFEHAAQWNPSLEGLDYNWGRAAFSASKYPDAIGPLSRHLRSHPDDSGIRAALAMSQFMTGYYAGSLSTLQSAGEEIMSIPQMQYIYGDSLVKTGQVNAGVERLQSLEKVHPEIAEVHRSLGEAFEAQGEKQRAGDELRLALHLNANDPETRYDLGMIELDGADASAAIQDLEAAVRLSPGDPRFHLKLADAYTRAMRTGDAEKERHIYDTLRANEKQGANTGKIVSE